MALAPVLYAVIYLAHLAQAFSELPPDVSNFIPSCAEECFLSFLDVHFGGEDEDCLEDASLQCFCSTPGATDFAIGEGAVQCLTAEKRFGSCSDYSVSDQVLAAAYRMCNDVSGAIQPTHEVITASVVLPTSEGGVVLFPPVTTRLSSTDTTLPPSTSTGTTQEPSNTSGNVSSTFVTSTRTSTRDTSTTGAPPTETGTAPPPTETGNGGDGDNVNNGADKDDEDDGDDAALNTPQIVGVSVGVAAAASVAILAIILARRCRRRNHPTVKTGFFPRRSTWGTKLGKPSGRTSTQFWAANQIRAPLDVDILPPPPAYQRRSPDAAAVAAAGQESGRPNGLGLTMGPPPTAKPESAARRSPPPAAVGAATPPQDRRLSKLLPAKPEMASITTAAAIVRQPSNRLKQASQQPRQTEPSIPEGPSHPRFGQPPQNAPRAANRPQNRGPPPVALTVQIPKQSDLTRPPGKNGFPRDSNITQFEEDSLLSPDGQIWRPPSSAPLTAMPYYVADGNGNWVLASPTKEWPTTSDTRSRAIGATLATSDRATLPSNVRGSGSLYSQERASARASLAPAPKIFRSSDSSATLRHSVSAYSQTSNVPPPLFYSNPRLSSAPPHPAAAYRPQPLGRNSSDDSDTTVFDSSSSNDPTPPEIRKTLTPVVESPFANNGAFAQSRGGAGPDLSGRSGLGPSYFPQNGVPNGRGNRFNGNQPPPTRPMMYYPPGQPSPTLGMMRSQPPQPGGRGGNGGGGMSSANNLPNKGRRPMDMPRVMGANQPATMRVVEPSPEPEGPFLAGRLPRDNVYDTEPPPHPNMAPFQNGPQTYRQAPHPSTAPQYRPRQPGPSVPYGLPSGPRAQPIWPQQQQQQQQQQRPQQLPLLNTQLPPTIQRPPTMDFQSPASERTVSSTASSLLAKRLGSDRAAQMAIPIDLSAPSQKWRRDGLLSPDPVTPKMSAELPLTPLWVPKLTPTRRGDDLFLNVQ